MKRKSPVLYGSIAKNVIINLREKGQSFSQIAKVIGVNQSTVKAWVSRYKDLKEAVQHADNFIEEAAEHSLIQLAMGYYGTETKVFQHEGEIIEHDVIRWYPPNPKALEFLLKNIKPDKWKDRHEVDITANLPTVSSFAEAIELLKSDPALLGESANDDNGKD